ncbi:YoaK family protein [Fusobacterium perfoetens]|uniref:YoaK family protein n=1 Tax=Fusobacterium perfoetens TaxID=852 RepID=UPI000687A4C5|nr:YoaK family protein [Fusobacterium perfoetens]
MSERYRVGLILAIVGGYLDAYTYVCRGKVFANAQTGNIVLFGIKLVEKQWGSALEYFTPIMAFVVGILLSEFFRKKYNKEFLHWRQSILLLEMAILIMVSFMPMGDLDILVNVLISFVCSLQVEAFRKFRGKAYASTMCTGNLRSASEALYKSMIGKNKEDFRSSMNYFGIITFFIIGGMIGAILTKKYLEKSVLFSVIGLMIVFIMMFVDYDRNKKETC